MSILHIVVGVIAAYLLGSIPFGYIIGRVFYHKNILEEGSGNIGTTNTFRVLGPLAGVVTFILDVLKGVAASLIANIGGPAPAHWWVLVFGVAAIIGHTYSVWLGFKGGKAVATSLGLLIVYTPILAVIALVVFLIMLLITSMVSLASILAFMTVLILSMLQPDWILFGVVLVLTIFVIYRHRENIKRMHHGNESLVPFGFMYWVQKDEYKNKK
ncbi:MAG: glycerol-3-phosphate 1-O-acyltransferase PlsY [Lactobacillaceae bacterium]|jgi:glycerol-3-phosphate acyltransferase PlsY|nr:glycerol-3-phosphate 1-O-acyltransferase PlsY [Lactobacillaceae bacterium]